jgi:hypothetical protein
LVLAWSAKVSQKVEAWQELSFDVGLEGLGLDLRAATVSLGGRISLVVLAWTAKVSLGRRCSFYHERVHRRREQWDNVASDVRDGTIIQSVDKGGRFNIVGRRCEIQLR